MYIYYPQLEIKTENNNSLICYIFCLRAQEMINESLHVNKNVISIMVTTLEALVDLLYACTYACHCIDMYIYTCPLACIYSFILVHVCRLMAAMLEHHVSNEVLYSIRV